ncbi:putative toxin-antitoxin system toxin component, PIN family [Ideonella paludis]|uniref:putative toxin-antitoxin system toxin component, PIN family n=1 Tax=Ideonella paludis TaxID=1233411 RepID=UPI001FE8B9E1|nr:putative toxin-antitoxin system toxin component, PIN family [Ideonella paludis]
MSEAADVGADADLDLPRIVLDTNVILDGWVFSNPAWAPIGEALAAQQLQWVVCASMLDELRFVLARPQPVRFEAARQAVLLDTERWQQARVVPAPSSEDLPRLRCSDPSDQQFIDLALAQQARWLISRDKALLKLARRAAAHGVTITTPEHWPGLTAHVHAADA